MGVIVTGGVDGRQLTRREGKEKVPDQGAIQVAVVELVRVAQQAVVAGRAAALGPAVEVPPRGRVDVAELEGLAGDCRERGRVLDQTFPDTDAALGGLPEQDALVLALADQLDRDLLFLDLVDDLDRALQGIS